jgi:hypothetical protein
MEKKIEMTPLILMTIQCKDGSGKNDLNGWVIGSLIAFVFPSPLSFIYIFDRVYAALFNAWKFYGYGGDKGIDLGASYFFSALIFCILGLCACIFAAHYLKKTNQKWIYRLATISSIIYFINVFSLLLLVSTDLAYLYFGR